MRSPELSSLAFLALVLVVMPLGARRTAQRLHAPEPGHEVTRTVVWRSAVIVQLTLLALTWFPASRIGYAIFSVPSLTAAHIGLGAAALGLCFIFRWFAQRLHSPDELRELDVYRYAPRSTSELVLFHVAAITAGVAEEAAYRGVAWSIMTTWLGSAWPGAVVLAVAFALAHWNQGWKSGVNIVGIALVFHALVYLTGTLVVAMAAHVLYNVAAVHLIRRTALVADHVAMDA